MISYKKSLNKCVKSFKCSFSNYMLELNFCRIRTLAQSLLDRLLMQLMGMKF
ncbi:hypothetical protein RchiOBHm_Chr5g0037531 [Rosa chinensis]|uniref:Uncharacterized protein n=1 Tax=Rosa chinensis TaxID=74649 RepID=A0A2P6QBT3_ROSCH|nr:hypothetical protein RchiOBHm_Chr5g0037531 [Rosa chinensis]